MVLVLFLCWLYITIWTSSLHFFFLPYFLLKTLYLLLGKLTLKNQKTIDSLLTNSNPLLLNKTWPVIIPHMPHNLINDSNIVVLTRDRSGNRRLRTKRRSGLISILIQGQQKRGQYYNTFISVSFFEKGFSRSGEKVNQKSKKHWFSVAKKSSIFYFTTFPQEHHYNTGTGNDLIVLSRYRSAG